MVLTVRRAQKNKNVKEELSRANRYSDTLRTVNYIDRPSEVIA